MHGGVDDPFFFNSMLANGLAQLLPFQERKIIRPWLQKLHSMPKTEIRDDYMWFLLRTLRNKRVVEPFDMLPPDTELKPLRQILPPNIYDDVVLGFEQTDYDWLNEESIEEKEEEKAKKLSSPPSLFLDNQPKPKRGVICYMAAFSDQQPATRNIRSSKCT